VEAVEVPGAHTAQRGEVGAHVSVDRADEHAPVGEHEVARDGLVLFDERHVVGRVAGCIEDGDAGVAEFVSRTEQAVCGNAGRAFEAVGERRVGPHRRVSFGRVLGDGADVVRVGVGDRDVVDVRRGGVEGWRATRRVDEKSFGSPQAVRVRLTLGARVSTRTGYCSGTDVQRDGGGKSVASVGQRVHLLAGVLEAVAESTRSSSSRRLRA